MAEGTGGEPVSTTLIPWERRFVNDEHIQAGPSGLDCRRRTAWTATDNQNISRKICHYAKGRGWSGRSPSQAVRRLAGPLLRAAQAPVLARVRVRVRELARVRVPVQVQVQVQVPVPARVLAQVPEQEQAPQPLRPRAHLLRGWWIRRCSPGLLLADTTQTRCLQSRCRQGR